MDYAPQYRLDPLPRSFAADAHGCIMVRVRTRPPEYKSVGAMFRAHWRVPLGSSRET